MFFKIIGHYMSLLSNIQGYCLVIGVKDKSQSTVRTRLRSTLVQVDVYLGMAQSTTTSITGHLQHDRWKTS